MGRLMLVIILMSLNSCLSSPDTADADTNSGSETSDTSDIDMGLDNKDPNLHNPIVISHLLYRFYWTLDKFWLQSSPVSSVSFC